MEPYIQGGEAVEGTPAVQVKRPSCLHLFTHIERPYWRHTFRRKGRIEDKAKKYLKKTLPKCSALSKILHETQTNNRVQQLTTAITRIIIYVYEHMSYINMYM